MWLSLFSFIFAVIQTVNLEIMGERTVAYWLDLADYDLETAETLIYLHILIISKDWQQVADFTIR